MTRLRIGVIYGGRSGEHEVSCASAAAIVAHLDPARYDIIPIHIGKDGRWRIATALPSATSAAAVLEGTAGGTTPGEESAPEALMVAHPGRETILTLQRTGAGSEPPVVGGLGLDVIFPVLHGPYGEDGTVQGLLELANVPYVGAGVLGSAVGMDKAVMKVLFAARGLPVAPYLVLRDYEWERDQAGWTARVERELGYPVFVKPANLGSSVGISKARSGTELVEAMTAALQFDRKIVVEAAVPEAREIECAVLGNDDPIASVPGEIVPSREFYDYEAKYLDDGSELLIPAPLSPEAAREIQHLSLEAFRAVDGAGLSRVDFLVSRTTGATFINEVNTLPGFTTVSMYPKLWGATGVTFTELLDRLIALALERHVAKQRLRTSVT